MAVHPDAEPGSKREYLPQCFCMLRLKVAVEIEADILHRIFLSSRCQNRGYWQHGNDWKAAEIEG